MATLKPRYQHDCLKCKLEGKFGLYDVYTCPGKDRDNDSLIARYGKKGHEYSSSPRVVFVSSVCSHLTGGVLGDDNKPDHKLPGWMIAVLGTVYSEEDSTMFGVAWDALMLVRQKFQSCECGSKVEKCEWCKRAAALDIK